MKKFLAVFTAVLMALSMAACSSQPEAEGGDNVVSTPQPTPEAPADTPAEAPAGDTFELALITDIGTINDKSFNQGSWEGMQQYAEENNITYKYYQPTEQSTDSYLQFIDLAVQGGAKVIVTPGFLFAEPIHIAQTQYPDVNFIIVDSPPSNDGGTTNTATGNSVGIGYREEQSGFLAGYAAVKDGYRKLGFMGGMALPAVVNFGYGFVQGAEYAAAELGLAEDEITVNYHYTGGFSATPEAQAMAASWYSDGVEVIFACGGEVGSSVMAAADQAGKYVIGVDVDQSSESPTVITSAMKDLKSSVYQIVKSYYDGSFPGGEFKIFDAASNGVALPMETSKFNTFTQADYDAIFAQLQANSINLINFTFEGTAATLEAPHVVVTEY
jgi:basic membrane protein A